MAELTVVQQLEEAGKKIVSLEQAALDAAQAHASALAALALEKEEALKALEVEKASVVSAQAKANEANTALETEKATREKAESELANAKKVRANPAYAAAGTAGSKTPVAEGGSIGGAGAVMTREQAEQEYKKIDDPVARARFRAEHKKELELK